MCPLALHLIRLNEGDISDVKVEVVYQPGVDMPLARMFEIFLTTDPPLELKSAIEGTALLSSGKQLVLNPETQKTWYEPELGKYRIAALSTTNTGDFSEGVLAELEFASSATLSNAVVSIWIERRMQILAPEEADISLQISPYEEKLDVLVDYIE